jgi:hypothetical protein
MTTGEQEMVDLKNITTYLKEKLGNKLIKFQ